MGDVGGNLRHRGMVRHDDDSNDKLREERRSGALNTCALRFLDWHPTRSSEEQPQGGQHHKHRGNRQSLVCALGAPHSRQVFSRKWCGVLDFRGGMHLWPFFISCQNLRTFRLTGSAQHSATARKLPVANARFDSCLLRRCNCVKDSPIRLRFEEGLLNIS